MKSLNIIKFRVFLVGTVQFKDSSKTEENLPLFDATKWIISIDSCECIEIGVDFSCTDT